MAFSRRDDELAKLLSKQIRDTLTARRKGYRSPNQNLRTTFEKIVTRAGLVLWPKPFQNLRSTRETELMET